MATLPCAAPPSVLSGKRHDEASISETPQDVCTHARACDMHTKHACIQAKQHRMQGIQYKASSALGTGRLVLASCGQLQLLAVSVPDVASRAHVRCCNKSTAICCRVMSTAGERLSLDKCLDLRVRRRSCHAPPRGNRCKPRFARRPAKSLVLRLLILFRS